MYYALIGEANEYVVRQGYRPLNVGVPHSPENEHMSVLEISD